MKSCKADTLDCQWKRRYLWWKPGKFLRDIQINFDAENKCKILIRWKPRARTRTKGNEKKQTGKIQKTTERSGREESREWGEETDSRTLIRMGKLNVDSILYWVCWTWTAWGQNQDKEPYPSILFGWNIRSYITSACTPLEGHRRPPKYALVQVILG